MINKVEPLTDIEVDIVMCRLQSAVWDGNKEKIEQILKEVRKRVKELKENGLWK